jgi:hypothetical protein
VEEETSAAGETRVRQSDDGTENTACLERKHGERSRKSAHKAQRSEETKSIIQHWRRKKAASMETEWRMESVKAQRGLGFLDLKGEVDACRYCTLGVHRPARWMSCLTKAERCHQSGSRKSDHPS